MKSPYASATRRVQRRSAELAPSGAAAYKTPAARVLHDLRNSLAALAMRLELATADSGHAEASHHAAMMKILEEARETAGRLEDMLAQGAHPERGAVTPRRAPRLRNYRR